MFDNTDSDIEEDIRFTGTSDGTVPTTESLISGYIRVKNGNTYYRNEYTANNRNYVARYDSDKNIIGNPVIEQTIVITHNGYIRFGAYTADINTVQLEQGSVATDYTPYNSQSQDFINVDGSDLDLLSVGTDIRDTIRYDNGAWYKDKYVGEDTTVVKAKTGWSSSNDNGDTTSFHMPISTFSNIATPASSGVDANIALKIGDKTYQTVDYTTALSADYECIALSIEATNRLYIRFLETDLTSVDTAGVETYLQANDVTFIYELDELETIEIESNGSLIQESVTTVIQEDNFATEFVVEYILNSRAMQDLLVDKSIYQQNEIDDLEVRLDDIESLKWDDLRTPMTPAQISPNNSKPDFDYTNIGLLFPQNDTAEIVYGAFQMPHAYAEGTNLRPHIHMGQALDLQCVFKIDYVWVNIGETIGSWTTITLDQYAITYVSGTLHQLLYSSTEIDGTGKNISSILKTKLYRDDNVYTADVLVSDFDIHFQIDSDGSVNELNKDAN